MEKQANPSILGSPSGQKLAFLCGAGEGKAAEATLSVSFPFRKNNRDPPRGSPFGFRQCGVCLMMGMENY
jgi:hypothetical protein